jgi:hypothetical protein
MPPQVSTATTIVRFHFPGDTAAAGLFVLWRALPQAAEGIEPDADLSDFALAFCGFEGTLHDVLPNKNPWALAVSKESGLAARLGTPPIKWQLQPYEVVLIGHPSPIQAKALLDRLRQRLAPDGAGTDLTLWQRRTVTPQPSGKGLKVILPDTPDAFVPRGHDTFNGWTLYRRMPYAGIADVKAQVKKLAVKLGGLRYPTNLLVNLNPYPALDSEHDGAFDTTLQACVRRFQTAVRLGVTFQLAPEGLQRKGPGFTEVETWAYVLGFTTALSPPPLLPSPTIPELDVVDADTAAEILRWEQLGLRSPGSVVVSVARSKDFLFAEPRLFMAFSALILTAKALGMAYSTLGISRTRGLKATAPGQVDLSFHKLGRAIDIDTQFDEPSPGTPLAFEANFVKKTELEWKLYVHSTLDPFTQNVDLAPALARARQDLEAELVTRLGSPLPLLAASYLLEVDALHTKLLNAATPNPAGGSQLANDFFRSTVSRFQYVSGAPNLGVSQPALRALDDAVANSVPNAAAVRSWLNLSRLAFHLGLRRIGADENKHGPVKPSLDQKGALTTIIPAQPGFETGKAVVLDRLAAGIRGAAQLGATNVKVTIAGQAQNIPISAFDLSAMQNWIRRQSDQPGSLSKSPKGAKFVAGGVDLTFEVHFAPGTNRQDLLAFLRQRAGIGVRVIRVGDGVDDPSQTIRPGREMPLGTLVPLVEGATAIAGKKDHTITLRPIFAPQLKDSDPGAAAYEVVQMHSAAFLEWWHLELQPAEDAKTWFNFAEDFGLDSVSLLANDVPSPDALPTASNPVPWMGGEKQGETRPVFPARRSTEPDNVQGTLNQPP